MSDLISRTWLMECIDEGWIEFDTEKDTNTYIHLVRDIAPSAQQETHDKHTETHECDYISRQAVIEIFTQLWDCIGTIMDKDEWEDVCKTTANELPPAQPETCEGCKHLGKWENEVECGYPSPCTRCKRRTGDHYER